MIGGDGGLARCTAAVGSSRQSLPPTLQVYLRTGLLPHINAGIMSEAELLRLKGVSASQGMMLESLSPRLMQPGGAHHGCPDKEPAARLATLEAAGRAGVPFTTGVVGFAFRWVSGT